MRRSMMAGAFAALGLGMVGAAFASTTINFSEVGLTPGWGPDPWFAGSPKGTDLNTQFLSSGALFEVANGAAYVTNSSFCTGTSSLAWGEFLAVNTTPPYVGTGAVLRLTFWNPTNSSEAAVVNGGDINFSISDQNSAPTDRVIVRSYDVYDNLLETVTLNSYVDVLGFTGGSVHRVDFFDNGSDGFVVDDLSFGNVGVAPEPGTLAVIGLGAAALLRKRRR